jgi:DNA-binding NtrC family response regulator
MGEAIEQAVERLERSYLEAALRASRGRVGEAAEHAGISRRTLLRKLNQYGIDKHDFRGP